MRSHWKGKEKRKGGGREGNERSAGVFPFRRRDVVHRPDPDLQRLLMALNWIKSACMCPSNSSPDLDAAGRAGFLGSKGLEKRSFSHFSPPPPLRRLGPWEPSHVTWHPPVDLPQACVRVFRASNADQLHAHTQQEDPVHQGSLSSLEILVSGLIRVLC